MADFKRIIESDNLLQGDDIRFLRSEMGLACAQFAQALGVAGELVEKWASDQESIDVDMDLQLRSKVATVLSKKICDHFDYVEKQVAKFTVNSKKPKVKVESKDIHIKLDSGSSACYAAAA